MRKAHINLTIIATALALTLSGCAGGNPSSKASVQTSVQSDSSSTRTDNSTYAESTQTEAIESNENSENQNTSESIQENKSDNESSDSESTFTERDLKQTADTSDAKTITVENGKTIDITAEGTYILNGTASDCTIKVNADKSAKVQLVLDGLNITNNDFPAIYIVSADKVFITTASDSSLSVTGSYTTDGENNTDAVIYSKDDIVLNGTGTLNILSAYGNGVSCKDDMKITGATYIVTSAFVAFEANDSILIYDGSFEIDAGKDGFHCENDSNEGNIVISGGSYEIVGNGDGIQAAGLLQIDGGNMNISAAEGLEATYILVNDGNITINATDDGINASNGSAAYDVQIVINGGTLDVTVGQGDTDAIDSNGSIYVNGGTISITTPQSSFDYDKQAEFNGGTIIVNGEEMTSIPQSQMGGGNKGGGHGGFRG